MAVIRFKLKWNMLESANIVRFRFMPIQVKYRLVLFIRVGGGGLENKFMAYNKIREDPSNEYFCHPQGEGSRIQLFC